MVCHDALGLVADGVEVHGDAVRSADLVLTAVTLADGTGVVVIDHEVLAQLVADLHGLLAQLLAQGQDGALIRSQSRMQTQHGADILLALGIHEVLLVVGLAQEGQRHTVAAQRRLDDVGDVVLVGLGVEVLQALAGSLLMAAQVVVGAVRNAPQLAPVGEREGILDVGGGTAVEGQLGGLVVAQTQVLLLDAEAQQPVFAVILPVSEPLQIGARLAEELALHLLELAGTEGEVARRDLIAEGLAYLTHAEGQLAAGGALDVGEVDEDALCGLRAEIAGGRAVLGDADGGLEHQVELADGGEVMLAADGADDVLVLGDELVHLVKAHGIDVDLRVLVPDELVGAVACLAGAAVQQRVGEAGDVAGGDPSLGVHDDGRIQTNVVRAFLHEFLQPSLLDVVLELNAQRAIVPAVCKAAVDLGTGENITTVLAEIDDHIKGLFALFHCNNILSVRGWLAVSCVFGRAAFPTAA